MHRMKYLSRILTLMFASFIYAIGVSLFLDPNDLAPGGITGISILLNRLINVETGTLILILNIPLLIIAWIKFGAKFVLNTFIVLFMIAIFSNMLEIVPPPTNDRLLASLSGGACMAVGLGIVLRNQATTGGTDIVVKLLREKYRHLRTGFLFMAIDIFIITISVIVFKNLEQAMYAGLSLYFMSKVLDLMLYGTDEAKLLFIISDHKEEIAKQFMDTLDIGVTFLDGHGAYTGKEKKIILCVMKKRTAPIAEEIVRNTDSNAFLIITSASEIYGEGYKDYNGNLL